MDYQSTFCSGSILVIDHFDKARVAEIRHPRFSPKPEPIPVLVNVEQSQITEEPEIKEDSMIYEYEIASDDRWAKKKVSSRRTKSEYKNKVSFLQSPQKIILAIGIVIGLMAGIIFLIN